MLPNPLLYIGVRLLAAFDLVFKDGTLKNNTIYFLKLNFLFPHHSVDNPCALKSWDYMTATCFK